MNHKRSLQQLATPFLSPLPLLSFFPRTKPRQGFLRITMITYITLDFDFFHRPWASKEAQENTPFHRHVCYAPLEIPLFAGGACFWLPVLCPRDAGCLELRPGCQQRGMKFGKLERCRWNQSVLAAGAFMSACWSQGQWGLCELLPSISGTWAGRAPDRKSVV